MSRMPGSRSVSGKPLKSSPPAADHRCSSGVATNGWTVAGRCRGAPAPRGRLPARECLLQLLEGSVTGLGDAGPLDTEEAPAGANDQPAPSPEIGVRAPNTVFLERGGVHLLVSSFKLH